MVAATLRQIAPKPLVLWISQLYPLPRWEDKAYWYWSCYLQLTTWCPIRVSCQCSWIVLRQVCGLIEWHNITVYICIGILYHLLKYINVDTYEHQGLVRSQNEISMRTCSIRWDISQLHPVYSRVWCWWYSCDIRGHCPRPWIHLSPGDNPDITLVLGCNMTV